MQQRKQDPKQLIEQYNELKTKAQLPLKLRLYFTALEELIDRNHIRDHHNMPANSKLLAAAFAKMSPSEKARMLVTLLTSAAHTSILEPCPHLPQNPVGNIETSCQLQTQALGISLWSDCRFKLDASKKLVSIIGKKRTISLNLEHYLVRKSHKHNFTIVFEAISAEVAEQNKKISVYLKETIFNLIYEHLFDRFLELEKTRLTQLAEVDADKVRLTTDSSDQNLVILNPERIKQYLTFKQDLLRKLRTQNLSLKTIYEKEQNKITIEKSQKQSSIYKLQFTMTGHSLRKIKSHLLSSLEHKYRYKTASSATIEEFSRKYKAVYDRFLVNGHPYEQLSIKQEDLQKEEVYFSMGIDTIMTKNRIKFVCIKVEDGEGQVEREIKIVVFAGLDPELGKQISIAFLVEFRDMMVRTEVEQTQIEIERTQQEEQFYSIVEDQEMLTVNFTKFVEEEDDQHIVPKNKPALTPSKSLHQKSYLTHKYILNHLELTEELLTQKREPTHLLFKEWKRCKNGGVVCINEEMLIEQKKMIKKIITCIGANIYKIFRNGGLLLTMSLPVNIFKKESHLQTIAGNFRYAPLLFDRIAPQDPLSKIRQTVLFVISVSNLGISSEKPFNPILGETLQCWIAGCPLYMQQISHHPPNSAYFFQGRGYKIHGQIQSKVGVAGINTAKCWSEKENYIQFEDGTKICFIYARMLIKGILIGDRQFHFEDKVYLYDMTNHYFCQLFFGPRRKGFMSKGDPNDYIHGKIVKTTTVFSQKFKEKKQLFPSKEDIALELSEIEGIWNESIHFDGKEEFNFAQILPYRMENEQHCLPSNSSYRKDLREYIKGNIEQAQRQKEAMEQEQRLDRKLRQKYQPKKLP